jgi:hypothetical protein
MPLNAKKNLYWQIFIKQQRFSTRLKIVVNLLVGKNGEMWTA